MKALRFTFIVALFAIILPSYAFAAKIPFRYSEEERLHRIDNIQMDFGHGKVYDLGYKTKGYYLFSFVGVWIENKGYILIHAGSENKYTPIETEHLRSIAADGFLPKDLPDYPRMSIMVMAQGFMLWLIIGTGLFIFFLFLVKKTMAREKLNKMLQTMEFHEELLIKALGLVALEESPVSDQKFQNIRGIFKGVSEKEISEADLNEVLKLLEKGKVRKAVAKEVPPNLTLEQQVGILHACLVLAFSDGHFGEEEGALVSTLSSAMGFSHEELVEIFNAFVSPEEDGAQEENPGEEKKEEADK